MAWGLYEGTAETRVAAPAAVVFAAATDHEDMTTWVREVDAVRLVVEGTDRVGLGAVREVVAGGFTVREEVVGWDPPRRMDYRIVSGMPGVADNGMVLTVVPEAAGTRLRVDVRVQARWWHPMAVLLPLVGPQRTAALQRGLEVLAARLASGLEQAERGPDRAAAPEA